MQISMIQMFLVVVLSMIFIYDGMNSQIAVCAGTKVLAGYGVGLILGNPEVGLKIGATLELMSLGVAAFGGASVPEYALGAMMGTIVAAMANKGADYGLMVGLPFSLLAIQLDVIVRTATAFFVHKAKKCADDLDLKKSSLWLWNGYTFFFMKYALPIIILFAIGSDNMTAFMDAVPVWLINGFSVAGGILPVVGIAVLLRFMNAKNYFAYLLIGFALVSFMKIPMIGVAIFGCAVAIIAFKNQNEKSSGVRMSGAVNGGMEDEL